jgi:hypothetical protein
MIYPPFDTLPASSIANVVAATPEGGALRLRIQTTDISGDDVVKSVRLKLGAQASVPERLAGPGVSVSGLGSQPVIASVRPGSEAARLKLRPGDRIEALSVANTAGPSAFLFAVPAILLLAALALLQRRRRGMQPVLVTT